MTIAEVKNYLNITWTDNDTTAKVTSICARATSTVRNLLGDSALTFMDVTTFDNTEEAQLFLDLCRYIYNGASEDFRKNYADEITALRAVHSIPPEPPQEVGVEDG